MTLVVLSFLVPVGIVLGLFLAPWGRPGEPSLEGRFLTPDAVIE